jgi:hypothetical protein
MQYSNLVNHGLVQTLDRLCGSTVNTYSHKSKCADLNDALDWYFQLAFKNGLNWEFDDINQTSPPIDTQTLTSGTNRYKLSAFTEKIVNLIRLEVLPSSGSALSLTPETLGSFGNVVGNASGQIGQTGNGSFDELYINAPSGTPTHYIKYGDFIYLRPNPNYTIALGLKAYFNRPASKFTFVSCQPEADDDLITATAHGLTTNDTVIFEVDSSGTMSTGITADQQYYVIASGLTANVFRVSTTLGGSTINITTDGTNVHFLKTSKEPGINSMHHPALVRKAALTNLNFIKSPNFQLTMAQSVQDERMIAEYFSGRDKDLQKRLMPVWQNNE